MPTAILDNPLVWQIGRKGLDLLLGIYRKRGRVLADWRLLDQELSFLDLGCGIGQFSRFVKGEYLGVDYNERYVEYAKRKYGGPDTEFRCVDATQLSEEQSTYDVVLMVGLLHHLTDPEARCALDTVRSLSRKYVAVFDPVREQPGAIGDWFVAHDRGRYIRTAADLRALIEASGLAVIEDAPLRLGPIATRALLARPDGPGPPEAEHAEAPNTP